MPSETDRALLIHRALLAEYGEQVWQPSDPIETLVSTFLSQNTNDVNRDRAFVRLQARYSTWEAVRDAPLAELIEAIRPAGLAPTKAPRIQEALRRISGERGVPALEFLTEMELEEARAWLLAIPGLGPKTAAIVLLFAFGRPAFPVDTHIHRVARRLGLLPASATREQAHKMLERMLPSEVYYTFHINVISHGRQVCHARRPECARCILRDLCPTYVETSACTSGK